MVDSFERIVLIGGVNQFNLLGAKQHFLLLEISSYIKLTKRSQLAISTS